MKNIHTEKITPESTHKNKTESQNMKKNIALVPFIFFFSLSPAQNPDW